MAIGKPPAIIISIANVGAGDRLPATAAILETAQAD
jgi:hypothetical protein